MCDTLVAFAEQNRSYFAKNSDRDPAEEQFVYISQNPKEEFYYEPYQEELAKYVKYSFATLKKIFDKFDHQYAAIVSKPTWIWGAEMGINEYGLAIGNEAVFSNERVDKNGLLGMDILRLALHNTKTAKEAVDFIINLIMHYGQGGDGGYSKEFYYHNSFLIKDYNEAYILETASKHWVVKEVDESATISNTYTITNDFDQIDQESKGINNFKNYYERKIISFFSKGDYRQDFSSSYLAENKIDLKNIMKLMRTHNSKDNLLTNGMKSICMHPGLLIKDTTTSSMIVEYIGDQFVVWFTGSPHPCVSLYKPLVFGRDYKGELAKLTDLTYAHNYSKQWRSLAKILLKQQDSFDHKIKGLRDKRENKMIEIMSEAILKGEKQTLLNSCNDSLQLADKFCNKAYDILT